MPYFLLTLFVYFSCLLDGSGSPCLFLSPAVESIPLAHAAHQSERACPSAAGDMEMVGPQQCHPKCILLSASAAKCMLHVWGNRVCMARKGMRSLTDMGFKWKSLSWLKNPCLLTTPLGPGAVCVGAVQNPAHEHQRQVNIWPFWEEDRAHLTQVLMSTYGT